ncbi:DedA family protein [Streptomyces sp. NPDC002851]
MVEWLDHYAALLQGMLGSPWLWLLIFCTAALDALLPFMPSEGTVVMAAVLIGADPERLALLWLLAAVGALVGDIGGYAIGRRAGPGLTARLVRGEKGRRRHAWACGLVERHAALLIVAGRYVPAGRVVTGLTTGSVRYPLHRFVAFDALGTGIWAALSVAIGCLGGGAFADRPLYGALLSGGAMALLTLALAGIRRHRRARARRRRCHATTISTDASVKISTRERERRVPDGPLARIPR